MTQEILINILFLLGTSTGIALIMSEGWYDHLLDKLKLEFKPFSCPKCMTFWISLIFLLIGHTPFLIALSAAFINAYIGETLYRKINFM